MNADARLDGAVALITGAGRGLGRSAAMALASAGADLVLGARSEHELERVADEARKLGRQCVAVATDVSSSESVDGLVEAGIDAFGRLDVVVNNAGIVRAAPIIETTDEDWDAVIATNLRGVFLVLRAAGQHLVRQGSGKVINVASHWALRGVPSFASYCASKAAVVNLTRAVALEWARHGVQVNTLAPGYFETDFNAEMRAIPEQYERIIKRIPLRRMGRPDELGAWIVFLASSASDFMTGEVVVLDGGESAR